MHGLTQHTAGAQQAVGWQQVPDCAQHVVGWQHVPDGGQHGKMCGLLVLPFVPGDATRQHGTGPFGWTGQQGTTFGADPTGQRMRGTAGAAPAGLTIARAHNEAARNERDDGTIRRRIAKIGLQATRISES